MGEQINIGDTVSVHFHGSQITLVHNGKVLYKPVATGDSWIFEDIRGYIHYVSEGCTVTKMSEDTDHE